MSFRFSLVLTLFILLCGTFFLTRVYRIDQSLLYFNDMGRDSLTLLDWQVTGKPPLLGPQTSALPFNQTALYFYLLYPAFVLTHHSPFSAVYTLIFYYLVIFILLFIFVRRHWSLTWLVCSMLFLILIHPQFIIQTRFVWNPSFVAPLILAAFISFFQTAQATLPEKKSNWLLFSLSAFCLAFATSLNLSVLPAVIAFCLIAVLRCRWQARTFFTALLISFGVINLPTIIFELRHHFLLLHMLLTRPRLAQSGVGFTHQLYDLINHSLVFPTPRSAEMMSIALMLIFICGWFWYQHYHRKDERARAFSLALQLFALTTFITLIVPVSIQAHYVFGVLSLAIITLCLLPWPLFFCAILFLSITWLPPLLNGSYYQPALRTVQEMQTCYAQICAQEKEPLFVSVQASFHPFHNGPEHRFLMREAGCNVIPIETQPNDAQTMAVVVDDSVYEHGKTSYNELSSFGPSSVAQKYICSEKLQVYILRKNASASGFIH